MDPFNTDDESAVSKLGLGITAAHQPPPPPRPPTAKAAHIEDPFAIDESRVDGSQVLTPKIGSSRVGEEPGHFADPAVDASTASRLLSNSEAGLPRHEQEHQNRSAVRMGGLELRPSQSAAPARPADAEEAEVSDEEAGLIGEQRPSSRHSGHSTLSRSSRHGRRAPRGTVSRTLQALGRRIAQAASRAEAEDVESRQAAGSIQIGNGHASLPNAAQAQLTGLLDRRERALWMWANIDNIDDFLKELYQYYVGKGVVCIALSRALNLLTAAFVVGFSTFIFGCLDFSRIRHNGRLSDLIVDHCAARFSTTSVLLLVAFGALYGLQLFRFATGLSRLNTMRHFCEQLLEIPDADIQTIPWHQVVERLSRLLETHPLTCLASSPADDSPQRIDVHEVANRLMRQHNYLIALLDCDLLDLKLQGMVGNSSPHLTKSLLWNLEFCLLGFLFDHRGTVRKPFLSVKLRDDLISGLRRRLAFMAILNLVFAPFIVVYVLIYSFFRYFEEYHKNPAFLGSRQYTELARWKFREYNELPHLFRRRCHSSYPFAERYIQQFPRERTAILARFVSFIAGSFAAVLLVPSLVDPDLFLHFDITPQRNTLFYIGVFGAILAAARGMIPDERLIFEPEALLEAIVHHTHYCPPEWRGRFHSAEVNADFGKLYSLKLGIFVTEVLSVIVTPFILAFSLPRNAPGIIDFFRDYTVQVDRLGHVCSYAVFDVAKTDEEGIEVSNNVGSATASARSKGRHDDKGRAKQEQHARQQSARRRHHARCEKMDQSAIHFAAANAWRPDHASTDAYLASLRDATAARMPSNSRLLSPKGATRLASSAVGAGLRTHFSDAAFERSVFAPSIVQPRDAGDVRTSIGGSEGRNLVGDGGSSASAIDEDYVDAVRGHSDRALSALRSPNGDFGDESLRDLVAAPGRESLMQHVQRRIM
ncbi:unnamed protein product [Parajaminaea phylloscopi]